MIALLIAVGGLIVAVIGSAIIDPESLPTTNCSRVSAASRRRSFMRTRCAAASHCRQSWCSAARIAAAR